MDALAPAQVPLGRALPDHPHAVSVSMPTWADVVGYEEGDPAVHAALSLGYPRFVFHPTVRELMAAAREHLAGPGEDVAVWPSTAAGRRCAAYLARHGVAARLEPFAGVVATVFPAAAAALARQVWQHGGEVVSSRRAEAALAGRSEGPEADAAREALRSRLAGLAGVPETEVRLAGSGMAAIHRALRLVQALDAGRGRPTAQVGFPYLDTLKLQERLGAGARFFPVADDAELAKVESQLAAGEITGVFTELPCNPLWRSVDLARLSRACRAAGVPLVVDDTAATFSQHDFAPYADVLVASLTKYFGGHGRAMGGVLVLPPGSPLHDRLAAALAEDPEEGLFGEDAAELLAGGRDFEARMERIGRTTQILADALAAHPAVARVWHPLIDTPEAYRQALRPGGHGGGMLSFVLADGDPAARAFYDRLAVWKGPGFGLAATLVCPYTQLAHFTELDWAASCGVPPDLIRVSVGLEEAEDLLARFEAALAGHDA